MGGRYPGKGGWGRSREFEICKIEKSRAFSRVVKGLKQGKKVGYGLWRLKMWLTLGFLARISFLVSCS